MAVSSDVGRAHWRLHRMLIRRIAVMALLIAVGVGVAVRYIELQRMHGVAVELASRRVAQFSAEAGDILAARSPDMQATELQARLDQFARGRLPPREGRIVAAMLYDINGRLDASLVQPDYAQRADAVAFYLHSDRRWGRTQRLGVQSALQGCGIILCRHRRCVRPMVRPAGGCSPCLRRANATSPNCKPTCGRRLAWPSPSCSAPPPCSTR